MIGPRLCDDFFPGYRSACSHVNELKQVCGGDAYIHAAVVSDDPSGVDFITVCVFHEQESRHVSAIVQRHAWGLYCDTDGAKWDFQNNICFMDDDGLEKSLKRLEVLSNYEALVE